MPPDDPALIAAARDAFAELGPQAGLDDIADHIGVSAAILLRHFVDRDGLISAVLDDLLGSLADDQQAPEPAAGPSRSRYAVAPLVALAAALPVAHPPAASAATAIDSAPSSVIEVTPLWPVWSLRDALQGSLCSSGGCDVMPYLPFSTTAGVHLLMDRLAPADQARAAAAANTVVFGFSHGAVVAGRWMSQHAGDVDAPSPDQLSFVLIGNPRHGYGGRLPAMPQTQYKVLDIVRQYDPIADFPDNPFNLLALLNIGGGVLSRIHLDYTGVDIDDPANTVWTEGNTTYVFVPTENLPLLAPLRMLGFGWLADVLNDPLKEIVEQAYDRPYLAEPPEPAEDAAEDVAEDADEAALLAADEDIPESAASAADDDTDAAARPDSEPPGDGPGGEREAPPDETDAAPADEDSDDVPDVQPSADDTAPEESAPTGDDDAQPDE
ncbi:PE-PPE domain-containing protein [Mycobacterium sp. pW049]|uniref:PE-PPE domain-containing protein n=1 Tax=[Mycobacterium] bulgaricum TaxID=3238985 RepID=UPI00351AE7A0